MGMRKWLCWGRCAGIFLYPRAAQNLLGRRDLFVCPGLIGAWFDVRAHCNILPTSMKLWSSNYNPSILLSSHLFLCLLISAFFALRWSSKNALPMPRGKTGRTATRSNITKARRDTETASVDKNKNVSSHFDLALESRRLLRTLQSK